MIDRNSERRIARELKANGFESAEFEARQIVLAAENEEQAAAMLKERLDRRPLQYILGEWEFYGLPFKVGEGVLIPRPDTEIVVETAIKLLGGEKHKRVLDVCAGSGCIGITLAKNCAAEVTFLEKSRDAIKFLTENMKLNGVEGTVMQEDVLLSTDFGTATQVDLIVSNPPYIRAEVLSTLDEEVKREPVMALDGGKDGLVFYRSIAQNATAALKKGGYLVLEIGFDQRDEVIKILEQAGFTQINCVKDYGGNDRVVYGKY